MIGIFDSGLGGLSALKEVRRLLPGEDIVYFGDTGRVPYGSRSRETIMKYAMQDMNFLMSTHPIDAVLVACGTVSSNAMDPLREAYPKTPIIGVIDSGADAAVRAAKNGVIGIIGTKATVSSHAFDRRLHALDPSLTLLPIACPLFVPLVENGFISPDDEIPRLIAERYLSPLREAGADTLILGCTHFPIISGSIARVLPDVTQINVAAAAAADLKKLLPSSAADRIGTTEYYVSDEPHDFRRIASIFLEQEITDAVSRIDIERY